MKGKNGLNDTFEKRMKDKNSKDYWSRRWMIEEDVNKWVEEKVSRTSEGEKGLNDEKRKTKKRERKEPAEMIRVAINKVEGLCEW